MTLEELKNKKVTITLEKTFNLIDDLGINILESEQESQKCWNIPNEDLINGIIRDYYSLWTDFEDIIESSDFKVTIHD